MCDLQCVNPFLGMGQSEWLRTIARNTTLSRLRFSEDNMAAAEKHSQTSYMGKKTNGNVIEYAIMASYMCVQRPVARDGENALEHNTNCKN